jgi:hypothetical protein
LIYLEETPTPLPIALDDAVIGELDEWEDLPNPSFNVDVLGGDWNCTADDRDRTGQHHNIT